MSPHDFSRRRFINASALTLSAIGLPACGGGGGAAAGELPAEPMAAGDTTQAEALALVSNRIFTTINVTSSAAGTRSYTATLYPLEGQVPANQLISSPDDATLASSVLSRWNDGSAAVMVVAGTSSAAAGTTQTLRLRLGSVTKIRPNLTTVRVQQLVQSVKVDFGSLGSAELNDFSAPERLWWSNPMVVCARYRLRAPGHATLEALVDIQAFASGSRALVEVVVENARMDSSNPAKPADANYIGVVSVNGAVVGNTRSSDAPEGTHSAFRAWYASTWVGGDPGLFAMQQHTDLQQHPLLYRMDQPGGDLSGYAGDAYAPWTAARLRPAYMGGAGDDPGIGPLPLWDAQLLQTGSPLAARAVQACALAVLSYNVGYRDSRTGLVPDASQVVAANQQGGWPKTVNDAQLRCWEVAHHPAAGLMAFASRPSPIFIEVAQRIVVWNATWSGGPVGSANTYKWSGTGLSDSTGVYGYWYQTRGRAWCLRSLTHATFLSPDGAWRDGGKRWLNMNRIYNEEWMRKPAALALGLCWAMGPDEMDETVGRPARNYTFPTWQNHFTIPEWHKAASAKLLQGSDQQALEQFTDWLVALPVRWVNEQPNGAWRFIPYQVLLACDATGKLAPTWAENMARILTTEPASVAGTWEMANVPSPEYSEYFGEGLAGGGSNGYYYVSVWWAALVAAVERGVPGAAQAWQTVQSKVTNLDTWRRGFGSNPRFGAAPRVINGQTV